ncbi:MAG: MoxR family ATPase [Firmicutes bacterium]|nr:MoxR family ATPase [Bacillota bacterium]
MEDAKKVIDEVKKAVVGKDDVLEKVLMAILAKGHVLLEDVPGVGKTTMAIAFSRAMELSYKRLQFTPDVMPSDVTGYTVFQHAEGTSVFVPGAVMCNLFLADEINRTSSKTQSALLEVMEESAVTVDGVTHPVPKPFLVIATQNPVGSSGTQPLPESQIDRFMVRLSLGYPDRQSEMEMLRRRKQNAVEPIGQVIPPERLIAMQEQASQVFVSDALYDYITALTAWTREQPEIRLGVSPRGSIALMEMAKACAVLRDRDYLAPEDVREVFADVCSHRIIPGPKARIGGVGVPELVARALEQVKAPPAV